MTLQVDTRTWELIAVNKPPCGAVLMVEDGIRYLPPAEVKELEEQCKLILAEKEG